MAGSSEERKQCQRNSRAIYLDAGIELKLREERVRSRPHTEKQTLLIQELPQNDLRQLVGFSEIARLEAAQIWLRSPFASFLRRLQPS